MDEIIITKHAYKRGKERTGLGKKGFKNLSQRAFNVGLKADEFNWKRINEYLKCRSGNANNVRLYGEFVYLFDNITLITVLHLNNHLKKYAQLCK